MQEKLVALTLALSQLSLVAAGGQRNVPVADEVSAEPSTMHPLPYCSGAPCDAQDDCCAGTVCILFKANGPGICSHLMTQLEGNLCVIGEPTGACMSGLECRLLHKEYYPFGICVNPNRTRKLKQYYEPCNRTMECDTEHQLCCRPQTPGKEKTKLVCSYFESPIEECVF